ncbi:MAG: superoxide dismutase family protein [Vicinamibacterales bacterium]
MNRTLALIVATVVAGTLSLSAQGMTHVMLKDAEGKDVGMAMLSAAKGGGVSIDIDFKGLPPGEHALHFHQTAKCEAPGFTTAGGHFNPGMKKHGMQNPEGPHAGDMANFTVAANGTAKATIVNKNVSLGTDANSVFANGGTALMIHAAADDMKSDPAGNAGARIACGTVTK